MGNKEINELCKCIRKRLVKNLDLKWGRHDRITQIISSENSRDKLLETVADVTMVQLLNLEGLSLTDRQIDLIAKKIIPQPNMKEIHFSKDLLTEDQTRTINRSFAEAKKANPNLKIFSHRNVPKLIEETGFPSEIIEEAVTIVKAENNRLSQCILDEIHKLPNVIIAVNEK